MSINMMKQIFWLLSTALLVTSFSPEIKCPKASHPLLNKLWVSKNPSSPTDDASRLTLLENAKQFDEKIAKGDRTGTYAPAGWSNRLGTVLTPATADIYTADRQFIWNNIDVGGKMAVVKLGNGDLWVHSAVEIDDALKETLSKLGPVRYVMAPNYEHLKYAAKWHSEYPDAYMWACPGLMERLPDIKWAGEIPSGIRGEDGVFLENCWDLEELQALHLDVEANPFTGKPFFNEVIFYHKPSKALIVTDVFWNYPNSDGVPNSHLGGEEWELAPSVESIPFGSKLWKFGMDKVYLPFYKKFMINDERKYSEVSKIILDEWEIETLIPAHGDVVRGKEIVREVLKSHLRRG
ncbi:unnamed protein product [Cylindrotheca closterium]|uniref:Metallo-beta-lactamase domain-containing protein n=1 Tax=Cylindrotheca closterium TaxID=2856 RepID=A0AAD2PWK3_9STRA|nr:unnamed protein product [Cylindrotheca closterium]